MRLIIASAALAAFSGMSLATMSSELTPFGSGCRILSDGADSGQDYVLQECSGTQKLKTYILYNEGTRMSVGFGTVPHTAVAGLATERDKTWPVQWLGTGEGDALVPQAAIARFTPLGGSASALYVFRLLGNGMSCFAGGVGADANQNQKAIELAERAVREKTCVSEPTRIEP